MGSKTRKVAKLSAKRLNSAEGVRRQASGVRRQDEAYRLYECRQMDSLRVKKVSSLHEKLQQTKSTSRFVEISIKLT
jgi:hypothetical protein